MGPAFQEPFNSWFIATGGFDEVYVRILSS